MRFTFINGMAMMPNLRHDFVVHRSDCQSPELRRGRQQRADFDIEADTPEAAVAEQEAEFEEQEMGGFEFHIHDCCRRR